ncbi:hypothetical protein AJ79_03749 [Helicocarpus griseus UAMH5409]|uniref:CHY-type domain-containing protein n=1 Tax=Helicocarpus griseus UAMH5409 TaxID=1447875 RepID=A0A2B7XXI1_9EURO|nr:hypothetical protein AJ79_03749 [Helicocarpus griseus UAMH5409]
MDTRPSQDGKSSSNRKSTKCWYFRSKKGCRAGDACPYAHEATPSESPATSAENPTSTAQINDPRMITISGLDRNGEESTTSAPASKAQPQGSTGMQPQAVQRPTPRAQLENPREFQINQMRRRFHPKEQSDEEGTHLIFEMRPSDPDFTFRLNSLTCAMHVPLEYPSRGTASLEITNENLEAEYKKLVKEEFEYITKTRISDTLLIWMNILDRSLARIFSAKRQSTVPASTGAHPDKEQGSITSKELKHPPATTMSKEKENSCFRREKEITQLTSRLGRTPLFSKSPDGTSFTLPISPLKPQLLPESLKSVKTLNLVVPLLYPLEPCHIRFPRNNDSAARVTEASFERHVIQNSSASLTSHINYLSAMIHTLAMQPVEDTAIGGAVASLSLHDKSKAETPESSTASPSQRLPTDAEVAPKQTDRPHIQVIPRPPEWASPNQVDESDDESDYSDLEGSVTEEDDDDGGVRIHSAPPPPTGRDVALSFPSMELLGIEILELKTLHLTLKCERCKELLDMKNIRIGDEGISIPPKKVDSCKKCGNYLSVGFRRELMHPNSSRAGHLDLDGCLAVELLPSNFIPTCSECSTTYPAPGIVAVRGDTASAVCRGCHHRMRFKIPEVKFLLVSAGGGTSHAHVRPRKPREVLGIVAGQELPRRGRCSHYGKSYRWFRFSCCLKVFPCDKCHDAATDHPNEHANRMICGFCSREQIYRPENCGICHSTLVGKAGSGFWEGGKGTRDKNRMSRKDPRKYKRRGGTTPGSSTQKK